MRRLPGPPALSEKQIGQSASPAAQARLAGTGAAANLRGAGLNVNLAPVLDVYRSAGDFIDQYGRSYSRDPRQVAQLGADFITAQQAGGVAATAKHFPGLGAAARAQDTDLRPVTLTVPRAALRGVDELPYRAAIAAGVKLVMLSWAVYPALDPARPAGLSPAIVQGELRQRLGFRGVTITDALGAGALARFGGIGHRGQLAALAGMDLLLCSGHRVAEGQQALAGLAAGYRSRAAQPGLRPGRGGPDPGPARQPARLSAGPSGPVRVPEPVADRRADQDQHEQQERDHVHAGAPQADVVQREQLGVDQVEHEPDADDHRGQPDDGHLRVLRPPGPRRGGHRHEHVEGQAEHGHREDAEHHGLRAGASPARS